MFLMEEFGHLKIQLQDIISATDNFSPNKLIGQGGFGKVYKGEFSFYERRSIVAVKRLDRQFGQGNTEFWKEIMMLSKCKHKNLVSLLHFCFEGDERILVYEYASRGSLDRHLSDASLTWIQRLEICVGVAHGLSYLHDPMETKQRILHRDIKSLNILLDEEWNAKVSDFGLSRVGPANQPHTYLVSNVVGTFGYCDPSYFETALLTKESDVYSFGVVLFEVMCGKLCCEYRNGEMIRILVPMWKKCFEEDRLDDIILHDLKEQIHGNSLVTFSTIANRCLHRDHKERPTMMEIVQELEIAVEWQLGINNNEESDAIKHAGVKLSQATPSFQEPPLLMVESGLNSWWSFDQRFTSRRRLPVIPCEDECFNFGHKESLCCGTQLLVFEKDIANFVILSYELTTNKWYRAPSMITPRSSFASATCGNSAFVAGGRITTNGPDLTDDSVEKYDAETRSWTTLPRMKKPRRLCSGCYMDGKFYVIGGRNKDEGRLTCGEFFDPERNQWTLIMGMLKGVRHGLGFERPPLIAVVNNELYLIEPASNELKVYLKDTNSWKTLCLVPVRVSDNKGWRAGFVSFRNELLVIGSASMASSSMAIYTCSPVELQSDNLPEWKLRDYGNVELNQLIYNCCVIDVEPLASQLEEQREKVNRKQGKLKVLRLSGLPKSLGESLKQLFGSTESHLVTQVAGTHLGVSY